MPVTSQNFAVMLKQLRTAHGMTQEELAERSGASVRSISDLERGISRFPRKDTVQLLADALQLSPDESAQLFAWRAPPSHSPALLTRRKVDCRWWAVNGRWQTSTGGAERDGAALGMPSGRSQGLPLPGPGSGRPTQ